jgi:hypothetical protein
MDPDGATLIVMVAVIVLAEAHLIDTTALGWLAAATRTGIVAQPIRRRRCQQRLLNLMPVQRIAYVTVGADKDNGEDQP